jgi:hypothetical protein
MIKKNRKKNLIMIIVIALVCIMTTSSFIYYKMIKQDGKSNNLEVIIPPSEKNDKRLPDGSASSPPRPTENTGKVSILGFTKDSSNYYFTISLNGITKGNCNLLADQTTKTANTQGVVELVTAYYTCSNMKVPISSLNKGKTKVTITIEADDKTTDNAVKELTLD